MSRADEDDLRLRLELRPSVPGWVVRVAAGVTVLGLLLLDRALAALGGTAAAGGLAGSGLVELLLLAAAVVAVWRPTLPTAPLVLALLGLLVLSGPDLLDSAALGLVRLVVLLVGTHVLARLTGLAAHTGWSARVETAVVVRWLAPVVPVQAAVLGLVGVVLAARLVAGTAPSGALRLVAVVAVVVAALAVAPSEWFRRLRP
ncbi:hypothetical protein [Actinotalea sp. Marseille-Q4924]|uniref:hypothetical protein n=1 Tax=Actinotalea sp. Marseille-Q4924 TaxID=2866571 RepID=UPI001CE43D55|nr:hypothetical protein [Actinotalea sp. Marseille-Q4924]